MMGVNILRTLAKLIYKDKEYKSFNRMLTQMIKDKMTMAKIRKHLFDLTFNENEVNHIMRSYYTKII